MTFSKLISNKLLSPNYNEGRNGNKIVRLTPHHMAWVNASAKQCCELFQNTAREASANYCIGVSGEIWGCVAEENRAWTTGSPDNDYQAITFELANDGGAPNWHISDATIESFINLCVDIIQRYPSLGGKFNYTGNTNGNITLHEWFQDTNCPGAYFKSKLPYIQEQVNKKLGNVTPDTPTSGVTVTIAAYDDIHKAWLPEVVNTTSTSDYAGIYGSDVDNVMIKLSKGTIKYRVHTWSGDSHEKYSNAGKWLPVVTGYNRNDYNNGYAGDNTPIDGLCVESSSKEVLYRVHLRKSGEWLPWVSSKNANINNSDTGFAGIIGMPIDAIEIKLK